MSFNLASRKQLKTATLNVVDPSTRQETGWAIIFAGPGHPNTIKFKHDTISKILRDNRAGVKAPEKTVDQFESEGVDNIVNRILEWTGLVDDKGDDVPFSADAAGAILADPDYTWVANACSRFINDDASFMPGSATA